LPCALTQQSSCGRAERFGRAREIKRERG